jgi:hypothetical protein
MLQKIGLNQMAQVRVATSQTGLLDRVQPCATAGLRSQTGCAQIGKIRQPVGLRSPPKWEKDRTRPDLKTLPRTVTGLARTRTNASPRRSGLGPSPGPNAVLELDPQTLPTRHRVDDESERHQIKHLANISEGEIILTRWVKPEDKRSEHQRVAHLIVKVKTE